MTYLTALLLTAAHRVRGNGGAASSTSCCHATSTSIKRERAVSRLLGTRKCRADAVGTLHLMSRAFLALDRGHVHRVHVRVTTAALR